ncbi:lipopolysaccharide assembly protein LapA domain-containing protein [Limosilactobacillus sp.]|uniref:lipopolysaccharide assembly protein LapA domain-containing protein n=1 Tax=Limosilactobacillus sp. TaxID=2773925 RepID=UPI003EFE6DD5
MKKQSTTIISIILIILVAIFAIANTASVEVNLLVTKFHTPLIILILVCLLIGALIIYLFSLSTHLKQDKELKALRQSKADPKQVAKLTKQNKDLLKENAALKEANARLAKAATPAQGDSNQSSTK